MLRFVTVLDGAAGVSVLTFGLGGLFLDGLELFFSQLSQRLQFVLAVFGSHAVVQEAGVGGGWAVVDGWRRGRGGGCDDWFSVKDFILKLCKFLNFQLALAAKLEVLV
jgi:hypothetical protein